MVQEPKRKLIAQALFGVFGVVGVWCMAIHNSALAIIAFTVSIVVVLVYRRYAQ